ncbi:MAG: SCP2 sterol-binding domain-containing protein [Coriobacteriales bacterium]|nr:SCP2 sterol-binding domain-containing protein [Coriobacteriales bacterium]
MTFEETFAKVQGMADTIDASGTDFLAVQVNLTGKADEAGVFYVEIKDGNISVAPYEYEDRSCGITMKNKDFNKLIDGKLDPVVAYTMRKLKVDGDIGKAVEFANLIKQ